MRDRMIGYSFACCLVLGVVYLKNKVFNKKLVVEQSEAEDAPKTEKVNENL